MKPGLQILVRKHVIKICAEKCSWIRQEGVQTYFFTQNRFSHYRTKPRKFMPGMRTYGTSEKYLSTNSTNASLKDGADSIKQNYPHHFTKINWPKKCQNGPSSFSWVPPNEALWKKCTEQGRLTSSWARRPIKDCSLASNCSSRFRRFEISCSTKARCLEFSLLKLFSCNETVQLRTTHWPAAKATHYVLEQSNRAKRGWCRAKSNRAKRGGGGANGVVVIKMQMCGRSNARSVELSGKNRQTSLLGPKQGRKMRGRKTGPGPPSQYAWSVWVWPFFKTQDLRKIVGRFTILAVKYSSVDLPPTPICVHRRAKHMAYADPLLQTSSNIIFSLQRLKGLAVRFISTA